MQEDLIVTFVGNDRPGIVQEMSAEVSALGGNWLESQMSRMAGKFAGVARISIDVKQVEALSEGLTAISGLSILLERAEPSPDDVMALAFTLSIIGPDRPGIMSEVTTALVSNQVNLAEVATRVGPAPMTGDQTFFAEVNILVPEGVPMVSLENALQRIADDLAVDIRFE